MYLIGKKYDIIYLSQYAIYLSHANETKRQITNGSNFVLLCYHYFLKYELQSYDNAVNTELSLIKWYREGNYYF